MQDEPHDTIDERNADYCCDDDLPIASQMSHGDRDTARDEVEHWLAKARAMLPPATVLYFDGNLR